MKEIGIVWETGGFSGKVDVSNGKLQENGSGKNGAGSGRLDLAFSEFNLEPGPDATIVTIRAPEAPFSFFLRDVNSTYPIFLPDHGAAVTESTDGRSFEQIAKDVRGKGRQTARQCIETEAEENFDAAAANTRPTDCPTWLGLTRDFRIFEFDFPKAYKGHIRPRLHNTKTPLPNWDNQAVQYSFALGRGEMCIHDNTRRLEDHVLPIVHGTIVDEDIRYNVSTFATLEKRPLTADAVEGTPWLLAYANGIGANMTDEQKEELERLTQAELSRDEQPVLFLRASATNTGAIPRYAWFQSAIPLHTTDGYSCPEWSYDKKNGFCTYDNIGVFCIGRLNGAALTQPELSVMIAPGETATFEILLPHRPIPHERALKLAEQSFDDRHAECRAYWNEKLSAGTTIRVPEPRIDEMIRAGLIHIEMDAYGLEPDGPIAACTGMYTPIGTESAPIIQFFDSMGRHDLARRALMFFLEVQREDGSMIAFGDYLIETGAVLWSIGEHYRYTRDDDWVREIAPKLVHACNYLIEWRNRSKDEALRGRGYGMIDGQICDFPDPYRHFALNGYAYLGLKRVADMLAGVDPEKSAAFAKEAQDWKEDIRESLRESMARSPVVPLGDGRWCPTAPPWAEGCGPVAIFSEQIDWYSKARWNYYNRTGAQFWIRDSLLSPQYLVFQEIIGLEEPAAEWLHAYHSDLFLKRNVASCQPYYSRHPWIHLKRGEVKAFLKAYYNTMAIQGDRDTYTFPEGIWRSVTKVEETSPHKTHEEGWFLMQTRWMLYMEDGDRLTLLPGVPRAWLERGKIIELDGAATYFGPVSLHVESREEDGSIRAVIECTSDRQPSTVVIRLPHPQEKSPSAVSGGEYDAGTESVLVTSFKDRAEVELTFS